MSGPTLQEQGRVWDGLIHSQLAISLSTPGMECEQWFFLLKVYSSTKFFFLMISVFFEIRQLLLFYVGGFPWPSV